MLAIWVQRLSSEWVVLAIALFLRLRNASVNLSPGVAFCPLHYSHGRRAETLVVKGLRARLILDRPPAGPQEGANMHQHFWCFPTG